MSLYKVLIGNGRTSVRTAHGDCDCERTLTLPTYPHEMMSSLMNCGRKLRQKQVFSVDGKDIASSELRWTSALPRGSASGCICMHRSSICLLLIQSTNHARPGVTSLSAIGHMAEAQLSAWLGCRTTLKVTLLPKHLSKMSCLAPGLIVVEG